MMNLKSKNEIKEINNLQNKKKFKVKLCEKFGS